MLLKALSILVDCLKAVVVARYGNVVGQFNFLSHDADLIGTSSWCSFLAIGRHVDATQIKILLQLEL